MANRKEELMQMAKEWGCDENPMVISLVDQYDSQYKLVARLLDELNGDDTTYVEEKNDRYHGIGYTINPLLKEIPKITEAANKTAALIMKTIMDVGTKPEVKTESALDKFFNDEDDEGDEDECGTDENGNS